MTRARLAAIEHHLPERVLSNDDLSREFSGWTPAKIAGKTGILERRIAGDDETSADLAFLAAQRLIERGAVSRQDVDFVLFCTQTPDHLLPTSACLLQDRLGLRTTAGALDFNLGCSGFVYGLSLAKGLVETGQARNVLLLTAETYSKLMHPGDRSVRTIFGDAGAAALVTTAEEPSSEELLGPFVFGTDGRGARNLIVATGGAREARSVASSEIQQDADGNLRTRNNLYMNGREIFAFTLDAIPGLVETVLQRAGLRKDDIDLFVFHQANAFMLDHLRKKLDISPDRFVVELERCGNTVSSTIPIALGAAAQRGQLRPGQRLMLVGFGVGYSWAAGLVRWN